MASNTDNNKTKIQDLYKKFNIDRKFDHPSNVTETNSHYDNGNYPPDWSDRREAVLEYQNGRCARCRTQLYRENYYNCHHYRPVKDGGQHSLSNLLNLCADCHKLIHPDVANLDGEWRDAPMFPHPDADPRMATVRKPITEKEIQEFQPEISLIAEKSPVGENEFANSDVTIPVSPGDALRMRNEFDQLLKDMGLAETTLLTFRTVNTEYSPLRDTQVEIEFPTSGTKMSSRTDKYGEVDFSIPSGTEINVCASKDGFDQSTSSIQVEGDEDYHEITLETSGQVTAAGASSATASATTKDSKDASRRPILKTLGLVGIGGVTGYLFYGERNQPSSELGNDDSGDDGSSSTEDDSSSSTDTPVKGFTEQWTDTTDTLETITTIKEGDSAIYVGTDSSVIRSLSPEGEENWTQSSDGKMVHMGTTNDSIILITTTHVTSLRKDSGETQWNVSHNATGNESRPGAANNEDVIVLASDGQEEFLQALSTSDGELIWEITDEDSESPVFLSNSVFYYSSYEDEIRYVEQPGQSGEKSPAAIPETSGYTGGLISEESMAYFISGGGEIGGAYSGDKSIELHAIDLDRKEKMWEKTVADEINSEDATVSGAISGPIINSGLSIYTTLGIWSGDLSGEELWTHGDDEARPTKPIWVQDILFYNSESSVVGCRRSDGVVTHRMETDEKVTTFSKHAEAIIIGTESGKTRMLTPE